MSCTCGRSPTGKCVGWHKLSEAEYAEKKADWEAKNGGPPADDKPRGPGGGRGGRLGLCGTVVVAAAAGEDEGGGGQGGQGGGGVGQTHDPSQTSAPGTK